MRTPVCSYALTLAPLSFVIACAVVVVLPLHAQAGAKQKANRQIVADEPSEPSGRPNPDPLSEYGDQKDYEVRINGQGRIVRGGYVANALHDPNSRPTR